MPSRAGILVEVLGLRYAKILLHSTSRQILADYGDASELDTLVREYLTRQTGAGRSVVIAFNGKKIWGTIDQANGREDHLLAAYLHKEGIGGATILPAALAWLPLRAGWGSTSRWSMAI